MSRKRTATVRQTRPIDRDIVSDIAAALVRHETTHGKLNAAQAAAIVKVQQANARLERQSNPLAYRDRQPEPWPTAPTIQQQQKGKFERKAEAGGVYSHRLKRAFENLSRHYPDAVLLALAKFYTDAESHALLHPRTVNLNSAGGGGFGSQIGRMSQAEERVRDQYERHKRVTTYLRSVDEECLDVLRWLVTEVRKFDSEKMPDVTEVGRRLVPTIVDRATSRGISIGYLKAVGQLLIYVYRHDRLQYGDEYRRNRDEFEDVE